MSFLANPHAGFILEWVTAILCVVQILAGFNLLLGFRWYRELSVTDILAKLSMTALMGCIVIRNGLASHTGILSGVAFLITLMTVVLTVRRRLRRDPLFTAGGKFRPR